jgi:hypothetical protein
VSTAIEAVERTYAIHGTGLVLRSEDAAVGEAIDRRLASFRRRLDRPPELRIEFLVAGDGGPSRLADVTGPSRPVYDTPGGEILYAAGADTIHADVDGVGLRCRPAAGLASIESSEYAGRRLYLAAHAVTTICLIELFKRRGRFNLHAACLARGGRGLLLAGPSGAGKSTLALGLVRAGLSFLADDMVYLEPTPEAVEALAFPDAIGVTRRTAELFPELGGLVDRPVVAGFSKRLIRIQSVYPGVEVGRCVPAVLIFPELVDDGSSRIVGLDPGDALVRLVPDVLLTEPADAQAQLRTFAALVGQVSCHVLEAGADIAESIELILRTI